MTDSELADIEAAVGFPLPSAYRRVARDNAFRPVGRDHVYWFFADSTEVIRETLTPLADGEYDRSGWRKGFLAIGHSPAGDLYLLDTQADGLPVYCLSHETHLIEPEWDRFEEFVAEWVRFPAEYAERREQEEFVQRMWWRHYWRIVGIVVMLAFVLPLLVLLLSPRR